MMSSAEVEAACAALEGLDESNASIVSKSNEMDDGITNARNGRRSSGSGSGENDGYGNNGGGCAARPGPSESPSSDDADGGSENGSSAPSPVSSRIRADSNSSDHGRNQKRGRRKMDEEMLELLESCPDEFGLRRSGRNRREVQRYTTIKSTDDEDSPDKRRSTKKKRNDSGDWKGDGGDTSGDEEVSDDVSEASDDSDSDAKRPKRKQLTKKALGKKRARVAYSSDEESDDDRKKKRARARTGTGRQSKPVDYREDSADEAIADSDVLEWSEEEKPPPATGAAAVVGDEHETIEKIIKQRIGRKGAVGSNTTAYNVEDRGNPNVINPGDDVETQYLIKWVGWAHIHNTWESEESLRQNNVKGLRKLENYINRMTEIANWKKSADKEAIEYFECEQEMNEELYDQYKILERVITHSKSKDNKGTGDGIDYFVKWQGLPYAESTWEDANLIARWWRPKIEQYHQRADSEKIPAKHSAALRKRPKFIQLKVQPDEYLGSAELRLRDYQLDGLNWLAHAWCKNNSVILADEMGLGKTIQTLSFLSYLYHEHDLFGPFLLVVPLSTLAAWQKECETWSPDLNMIVYLGDVGSREIIRQYEWYLVGTKKLKFNCVLTTYEILLKDKAFLGAFDWAGLLVDEAHRLKNDESLLYKALFNFSTNHRLLITGTPLQNSLKELWALLHFIMPERFDLWDEFEVQHQNADKKGYASIHKELEPYLLRRVKKDVEKSLPAKVEQILRVDMTSNQKTYYKWILTRNYRALTKGQKGATSSFINIVMELKKCCNHSYLVRPPDVEATNAQERLQQIVRGSGKLILLDKLLCRLKQKGHRVLIFSQMVMVLDILQEYLRLRKFQFQRLDGSIRGDLRRQALDHFNAEGSNDFCFLLSTRAGGLGINLATADTVIIFDSDWNPQNDLQAQSRAHRIGQKKQVNIYRLVTKNSVEEDIVERAKRKLVLDHLVIQRMDTTGRTVLSKNAVSSTSSVPFNKEELASILKFGAEELFKEGENEGQELEVDIDDILQRAETRELEDSAAGNELLDSFKVANFNIDEDETIEMGAGKKATDDKDWESIIPEADRRKIEDEERQQLEAQMYLPPRQRNTLQQMARNEDPDEDYDPKQKKKQRKVGDEDASGESDESEEDEHRRGRKPKKVLFGFTDAEIKRFVRTVKKFGRPLNRLDAIACDAELEEHSQKEVKQLCEALLAMCVQSLHEYELEQKENVKETNPSSDEAAKKRARGPVMKLGLSEFPVRPIIRAHEDLEPLYAIMPETVLERKHFRLPSKPKPLKNWDVEWTDDDDAALLRGVYEYGFGSWESIKMDPELGLAEKVILADKNKKPQAKHLQTRVDFLLRFLSKQKEIQQLMNVRKPNADSKMDKNHSNEKSKQKPKETKKQKAAANDKQSGPGSSKKQSDTTASPAKNEKKDAKKRPKNVEVEEGEIDDDGPKVKQPKVSKSQTQKSTSKPLISAKTEHLTIDRSIDTNLDEGLFAECKVLMRPVKKALGQLTAERNQDEAGRSQNDPAPNPIVVMRCLLKIGDHISECLASKATSGKALSKWHTYLWIFVSKFTEDEASELLKKYNSAMKRRGEYAEEPSASSKSGSKSHHSGEKHKHHHRHRETIHYHREDRPDRPKKHEDEKPSASTSRATVNGAGFGYGHSDPPAQSNSAPSLGDVESKGQNSRGDIGRGSTSTPQRPSNFSNFRGGSSGGSYSAGGSWSQQYGSSGGYAGDRSASGSNYRRDGGYNAGGGARAYGNDNRSGPGAGYGSRGGSDRYSGAPPPERYGQSGSDRYGSNSARPSGYDGPFDRRPGGRDSYGGGYGGGRRSPSPPRGYDHFQRPPP